MAHARWMSIIQPFSKCILSLSFCVLTIGLIGSCEDPLANQSVNRGGSPDKGGTLSTGGNPAEGGVKTSGGSPKLGGLASSSGGQIENGAKSGGTALPDSGRDGSPSSGGNRATTGGNQIAPDAHSALDGSVIADGMTGGSHSNGGALATGGTPATTGGSSHTCTPPAPGSQATNPLTTKIYTADPAPFVHNCIFYIHAGHDVGNQQAKFQMNDWAILKSTNLVDWTVLEKSLTLATFKWANANAWASQMVTKNGKFYWYVPVNKRGSCPNHCGMAIGVAVSDNPTGPFTDAIGKPLIDDLIEMANWNYTLDSDTPFTIDPTVFVDSDGSAYMHYGSFGRTVHAKLGNDMVSLDGKLTQVDLGRLSGVSDGKTSFFEAPFLIKRNGKWYEIYAAGANPAAINYSMADHPAGPWKAVGRVLDPLPNVPGQDAATNHAGIAEFAGQWYIVYHVSNGPNGGGTYQREVAMEKLTFNSDGTIKKVVPTNGTIF